MSRKFKKGYFVRGQFVAEGSELDLELKRELKGGEGPSKTDLKRESTELQKLGEDLLILRGDLFTALDLPTPLHDAVVEAKRITNFEGKRRQMQYIGKQMRKLDVAQLDAIREALDTQRGVSAREVQALHAAEQWRERLLASDDAVTDWMAAFPDTDAQPLRALIRQARKDNTPATNASVSQGLAPRQSRAHRELFQLIKAALSDGADAVETNEASHEDGDDE